MGKFEPKNAISKNDSLEHSSIRCLEEILACDKLRTYFSLNDKTANIDGYIELLNDRKPIGKISVQIKTFPRKYQKKNKFDFPISIFGYAQNIPSDIVILFAVDSDNQKAYWKHISNKLIKENEQKHNKTTITLSFEEYETVTKKNLEDVINWWNGFYNNLSTVIKSYDETKVETENLKNILKNIQSSALSYNVEDITCLQKFIEEYNYLLSKGYLGIKDFFYPNTWKIGIAVFEFTSNSLSYLLYQIPFGQNDLILKEIPIEKVKDLNNYWDRLYRNARETI